VNGVLIWLATRNFIIYALVGIPVAWTWMFPLSWLGVPGDTVAPAGVVFLVVWWVGYLPLRVWFGYRTSPFLEAWISTVGPFDRRDRAHILGMRKVLRLWLDAGAPQPADRWLATRIRR
jgi:hypothetical protein